MNNPHETLSNMLELPSQNNCLLQSLSSVASHYSKCTDFVYSPAISTAVRTLRNIQVKISMYYPHETLLYGHNNAANHLNIDDKWPRCSKIGKEVLNMLELLSQSTIRNFYLSQPRHMI